MELVASCLIEPWGEERADLRSAVETAHLLNAWRGKNSPAISALDVLLRFGAPEEDLTPEEQALVDDELVRQMTQT